MKVYTDYCTMPTLKYLQTNSPLIENKRAMYLPLFDRHRNSPFVVVVVVVVV